MGYGIYPIACPALYLRVSMRAIPLGYGIFCSTYEFAVAFLSSHY